ncbi:uncharacterized protein LALA0_S01e06172g [Lachancea lanzarotensis]|uniref:LALA0S01e06172g1_1 n=1 Tax=Lachancea lanzarotensis TaxID=1245769 RepID=A0A0C7MSI5_9SACH|nr:uncharacterized protein LALA0_S01e06172g [Lachancea lanzarotensis]CEP60239.1 LALA0S01e06172g1_1 [Lachancea lanzarotensis]
MIPFAHKGKSKRPKFLFQLRISELTNIPQSSGYCFVKWHFKDGTGTTSHSMVPSPSSPSSASQDGTHVIRSSSQNRGATPRVLVKHHRASWDYTLPKPVLVKLTTDKNRILQHKELVLEVYFEFLEPVGSSAIDRAGSSAGSATEPSGSTSNSVYTQKVSRKVLLGVVEINIAEYINREQRQIPSRFLLQKSKVNSILSLAIQMELARGSFDDFEPSQFSNSGQLPNTFRNGISEVFDASSDFSSPISSTFTPNGASTSSPTKKTADGQGTFPITINNPFVDKLYQKTFQVPWDPRPGELNPKECVEDILDGGDGWAKNEKGVNLIDIDALHLAELEKTYDESQRHIPMEMNHGEFDRRAFVERRVGVDSHTNTQKRGVGDRKPANASASSLVEDIPGNGDSSYFKSWTINKILP